MKEKQNYTARCDEQGHILVKMPGCEYGIEDKEVAIKLAQSILSAVDVAWTDESENECVYDDKVFIAIGYNGSQFEECEMCFFNDGKCFNAKECESSKRKDSRNIYWEIKE